LYYSFGPDLWQAGWKKGQSVMLFCGFVTLCCILYTAALHKWKREVFDRSAASVLE
jgi:hypothetical protein